MKQIKKIWDVASWIIVSIIVAFIVINLAVKIGGIGIYSVLTGSMEPKLKVGSLIYVKSAKADELKKGDIICFKIDSKTLATHRIFERIETKNNFEVKFRTKGDANPQTDVALVNYKDIKGKVILTIPILGYVVNFFQRPAVLYIIGSLLILVVVVSLIKRKRY